MNVSLTPALEEFVNSKVATGLYNSASEVIREALRLLISKEKPFVSKERLDAFNKDIEEELNSLDSGNYVEGINFLDEMVKKYE